MKIKSPTLLEAAILSTFVLVVILRFWQAIPWFSFNYDEEYQAFLAWAQVLDPHIIWIGVSASNFGFYLGPGFTYLNAILFSISQGDLWILALFSPVLGIVTIASIYFVISRLFDRRSGIFSALVYGLSPLMNFYDRRFWNPTPIPFLCIWFLFSIYKAEKDTRWYVLSAVIMATALHIHLSLVVLWPLLILCVLKNFRKISLKTWAMSILVYCLVVSPLIVFDFVHNFDDLLGPVRYFMNPDKTKTVLGLSAFLGHLNTLWSSLGRILYLKPAGTLQDELALAVYKGITTPNFFISLLAFIPLAWLVSVVKKRNYGLLLLVSLLIPGAYLVYPASSCEYFLVGFFTFYTIIIGLFLAKIPRFYSFLLILIFGLTTAITVLSSAQSNYGFGVRKELVNSIREIVSGHEFYVTTEDQEGDIYFARAGWCYLIRSVGLVPNSCPADETFAWIYPNEKRGTDPKYHVVVSENNQYNQKVNGSKLFTKGAFSVEIIDLK